MAAPRMSKAKLAVKHMQENLPYTRPANVPLYERKQVYLPRFRITLIRSPFLPPRYATFLVPLEFNKLDLKDYLKRLYNVDTLKIRSYVEQQRITRESKSPLGIAGPIRRPKSKKRMIVELVEPFVWPPAPEDSSPWNKEMYDSYKEAESGYQDPDDKKEKRTVKKNRSLLAEQAEALLAGREQWTPTWKTLGLNFTRPGLKPSSTEVERREEH